MENILTYKGHSITMRSTKGFFVTLKTGRHVFSTILQAIKAIDLD